MSTKTKPKSCFALRHVIKAQLNIVFGSNVWLTDLRDICESVYHYVFYLTCVMAVPGETFQTVTTPNSTILDINLTHWTTKTPQNVLEMSTVSPDTSRETAMPLTDGCNNNRLVKFSAFD